MDAENNAPIIDPASHIRGPVLVLAPHSDDETLGCGATIALLAGAVPVHVAYASDGRLSPSTSSGKPVSDWHQLVVARENEAKAATTTLGLNTDSDDSPCLHFLGFEDANLRKLESQVADAIRTLLTSLQPQTVFLPFRYDQHPDHLAVHRAATVALAEHPAIGTYQYFVYYRYPLLAERDIRQVVNPAHCVKVNIEPVAEKKRSALACYTSQVTRYYRWQERPLLRPGVLDENCRGYEYFVTGPLLMSDRELFRKCSLRLKFNVRFGATVVALKKYVLG